jgi:anthranilate synthase/aminodeoxychorismate synthase-like glutamine amidotransferase
MILVVDNYDSFTYNVVQALGELGCEVVVRRNDAVTVEQALELDPSHLIVSPGPGGPEDAGVSMDLIRAFAPRRPVLGICLGHQCLARIFGGRIVPADRLMHGKTSRIYHDGRTLFRGLPNPFPATRYHSLLVEEESLPGELEVSAHTSEGEIMGLRLRDRPVEGVQFHPESILTEVGPRLLRGFLAPAPGRGGGLREARPRGSP